MLCLRMEKRFCFEWQAPGLGNPSARLVISGAGRRAWGPYGFALPSSLFTLPFLSSIRYNLNL